MRREEYRAAEFENENELKLKGKRRQRGKEEGKGSSGKARLAPVTKVKRRTSASHWT